jgi:transposase-like protein
MATKRKITCVTLETKFLAISEKAIADKFGIPPSTLSTWIKNSEKIQAHYRESGGDRMLRSKAARTKNIPLSGPILYIL